MYLVDNHRGEAVDVIDLDCIKAFGNPHDILISNQGNVV